MLGDPPPTAVAGRPAVCGLGRLAVTSPGASRCQGYPNAVEPTPLRADALSMVEDAAGYRAMFELSPVAQAVVYPGRVGVVANQAFADLFGYEQEALGRMSWTDLVREEDRVNLA